MAANPGLTNNCIDVTGGEQVTIANGSMEFNCSNVGCYVGANSSLTVDRVDYRCNTDPFFAYGEGAQVRVLASEVYAGEDAYYGLSTNAGSTMNYPVVVDIEDSLLSTKTTAILFNVPGTLDIKNSTIEGQIHSVIVRGGEANISGSTLSNVVPESDWAENSGMLMDENWGTGNYVPLNALVVGNRYPGAYQYPAKCTLTDTDIVVGEGQRTIYIYGNNSKENGASLYYDDKSSIGNVVVGGGYVTVNGEQKSPEQEMES